MGSPIDEILNKIYHCTHAFDTDFTTAQAKQALKELLLSEAVAGRDTNRELTLVIPLSLIHI